MSYTLVSKPTISAQDGGYADESEDGGYAEDGPLKFGIPYGGWADSGDGYTPVFPQSARTYSSVSKPSSSSYTLVTTS